MIASNIHTIKDIILRSKNPGSGHDIPWSDPDFSRRILVDQLNPENDIGCRRESAVDQQVQFIHNHLLAGKKTKILDLGCGPGLYSHRLAKLGHSCTGIDISPTAITFAKKYTFENSLDCQFIEDDFTKYSLPKDFGLVMLTFGDFNSFVRDSGKVLLQKISTSLKKNGLFLLEVLTTDGVIEIGEREPGWLTAQSGMFSDNPYLFLDQYSYNQKQNSAHADYFIIDSTGKVDHFQQNYMSYSDDEYYQLLIEAGFDSVEFYPGLGSGSHDFAEDLQLIVARK